MARGARKTGGKLRRETRRGLRRVPSGRPVKTRVLIVGEGKTERNYFDALKREDAVSARFAVTVKGAGGFDAEYGVRRAIVERDRLTTEFDEVWCVLDTERPRKRASLKKAIRLAGKEGIRLCLSNPCFEVWVLAHFERTARHFADCSAVVRVVARRWKKQFGQDYRKSDDLYGRLVDLLSAAVANARWVRETHHKGESDTADCNSSTDVYRLVGHLLGSPDAI